MVRKSAEATRPSESARDEEREEDSTPLCRQCGSVRTRVVPGQRFESLLARLLNQRVIVCGRCGWRGRMKMETAARAAARIPRYTGHVPPVDDTVEPDLASLDKALEAADPAARQAHATFPRKRRR